jgi:F-type H+-transporting ATPase subunit b
MVYSLATSVLLAAGDPNPLDFKSDLALWTAVVFLLLLAVLWKFAWKPIAEGLDSREKHISGQIADAERANHEARQLLADHQTKLASAQDEVRGIIDQARRDAEKLGREMLDKAKSEAAAERQRSLQQIETATAGALQELAQRSATLAVDLAGKIVRSRLNAADHAGLIQKAVDEFTASRN